jgi:hypothetical protein
MMFEGRLYLEMQLQWLNEESRQSGIGNDGLIEPILLTCFTDLLRDGEITFWFNYWTQRNLFDAT